jgi:biotin operon repressor
MNVPMPTLEPDVATQEQPAPPLLYEMVRSFVILSRTLNLSHAVEKLGSTRQTVRRHIQQLEALAGTEYFYVVDRRYQLTEAGLEALPEAENILARCNVWAKGQVRHKGGMPLFKQARPHGGCFLQQQKPLRTIWGSDRPLLAAALKAWTLAEGALESPHLSRVRPFAMVYRRSPNGWICVELGEQSSYASWFGTANARSSVGRVLGDLPGGSDFAKMVTLPFSLVEREGHPRLDHVYTQVPRTADAPPVQICYTRLLLGCHFPDGSFALVSMVDRHNDIDISGAPDGRMPEELVMSVDPNSLIHTH